MNKPLLVVDFDGVLHSYTSGWKGAAVIPDPPVPGAIAFLHRALDTFRVAVFSSRSGDPDGLAAMQLYLRQHMEALLGSQYGADVFMRLEWPTSKPAAFVTLDDRAVTFNGTFPDPSMLRQFKPWNVA